MAPKPEIASRRMITFVLSLLLAGLVLAGLYVTVLSPGEVQNAPPTGTGEQDP